MLVTLTSTLGGFVLRYGVLLALWLLTRPGGWAVVAAAILVLTRLPK